MSDMIRYDYAPNYAHLDDIQSATADAQALRDSVNQVFNALFGVYEGQAAEALQQKHVQISQAMDNVLAEITQARARGSQSQEDARALDAHLAGQF